MLPKKISFVDVETTGLSSRNGRIIEIGIIRVEDNKVVDEFSTLINPQTHIDPFILSMTGINPKDVEDAPSFYQIKDKVKKLLADSLFVAHNALFDYSFIKREFERLEEGFASKICCSVKLSRNLYPKFKHHNLDALIERFNFECQNRHRAFDDAKIIYDFYQHSLQNLGQEKLVNALKIVLKRPSLPINLTEDLLDSLPETAGVYIFYNKENTPLYIGKSIDIRTRVLSHFSSSTKINVDMKISQDVTRVESIETAGELGALLLEATLVKKMQPLYNRQLRHAYKLLALKKVISKSGFNLIEIVELGEVDINDLSQVLGIFKSKKDIKNFLLSIAKEYNLCPKLLGIENGKGSCFNFHLGSCFGACSDKENFLKYNLRFDEAFFKTKIKDWPFKGPIGIKEKPACRQAGAIKEEIFVIDKWCVLGSIKNEAEKLEDISRDYLFDSDTYKILNRYLRSDKNFEVFNLR